ASPAGCRSDPSRRRPPPSARAGFAASRARPPAAAGARGIDFTRSGLLHRASGPARYGRGAAEHLCVGLLHWKHRILRTRYEGRRGITPFVPPTFLDIVEVVMQCGDRQPIRVVSPRGYRKTFRRDGSLDTALGAVSARRREDAIPDTVT